MKLVFEAAAWAHFQHRQDKDKGTLRRIIGLIKECLRHPFEGAGKPEPLKGDLAGLWSRRIDREHRLVYRVTQDALEIVTCRYHYGE